MRIEQLTFTRFIAAISIVIYHYGKNTFPFNQSFLPGIFEQANVGVSYFFILSGFVMVIAYSKYSYIHFKDYIKRRLARIYPVYLLASLILLPYLFIANHNILFTDILLNLSMLQSWFPSKALSFNVPAWSLSVEMFFYTSFPLLINKIYAGKTLKSIFLIVLSVFVVSQLIFHFLIFSNYYQGYPSFSHSLSFYFPLLHINEFLIGNLAGFWFIHKKQIRSNNLLLLVLFALLLVLLVADLPVNFHNGLLAILFVPIIVLLSSNKSLITRVFKNKIFVFLGEISYGIYILQFPVFSWCKSVLKHFEITNAHVVFYIGLTILIALSALSYTYVERPLRKRINKLSF